MEEPRTANTRNRRLTRRRYVVLRAPVAGCAQNAQRRAAIGISLRHSEEAGVEFARQLGSLVSGLILFVVVVMAIGQLRFDTDMVRIVTVCILSGLALAFGLSIGLGTRDVTRNVLAGFYARKIFRPGEPIEVRGQRGVLRAITATQTLIDHESGVLSVANSVFLDESVRQ